jgi:dephospho-CoA kinase
VENNKLIIAFVGMPGSGKTEACSYVHTKGLPSVRFGDITDEGVKASGLPLTPENEQNFRESLREKLGMAAYAIESESKIEKALQTNKTVLLDGLYSWAEYIYLKEKFPGLMLVHVYAMPKVRYKRLAVRKVRPIESIEAYRRDIAEIEKLDKGGPIAIADYMIENNGDNLDELHKKVAKVLEEIGVIV